MASHGRKGIKRLLLGSETQHVDAFRTFRCWYCDKNGFFNAYPSSADSYFLISKTGLQARFF